MKFSIELGFGLRIEMEVGGEILCSIEMRNKESENVINSC